jgi:type II secretory pathway pseudopilin PulG
MDEADRTRMDEERFRELSADFLLGELAGEELAEFQAELERRGEAGQAELARMRDALALVGLSSPATMPPRALRERLLNAVATAEPDSAPASDAEPGTITRAPARPADVIHLRRQSRAWQAAAAVAAILATLVALWNVRLRQDLADAREEVERVRARLAAADSAARELAAQREELETQRRDVEALVSPRGSEHKLTGTPEQPGAVARIFVDPVTGRALLFAFELPILPPDQVYELWAIKGGVPVAAGTFSTTREGRARLELPDPRILEGVDALAVTVEPAPGTQAPTGKIVLSSS